MTPIVHVDGILTFEMRRGWRARRGNSFEWRFSRRLLLDERSEKSLNLCDRRGNFNT